MRRWLIPGISLIALLTIAAMFVFGGNMEAERALDRFAERVEQGRLDDVRLIIYYMNPFIVTLPPTSVEWLVSRDHQLRIVVEGDALIEHIDSLRQINSSMLIPYDSESTMHASIYFVFETTNERKLFDVAMWMLPRDRFGPFGNILVNGQEFMWNNAFADIIMPFLPEEDASRVQLFIDNDGIWPGE